MAGEQVGAGWGGQILTVYVLLTCEQRVLGKDYNSGVDAVVCGGVKTATVGLGCMSADGPPEMLSQPHASYPFLGNPMQLPSSEQF